MDNWPIAASRHDGGSYCLKSIISMYSETTFDTWAEEALKNGRPTPNTSIELWEDFDVAQHYVFIRDQIRARILDLQSLELWVWVTGPNNAQRKKALKADLKLLQKQYIEVHNEILRRY